MRQSVLKVRLDDLVAEIIFGRKTHLLIAGNLSQKEVGKGIAGGSPASVVEGQDALDRTETALLVSFEPGHHRTQTAKCGRR